MSKNTSITVDKFALDDEWERQVTAVDVATKEMSAARERVDRAKVALEQVDAELDLQIRENPASFNIEKITEAAIKAAILNDPGRKTIQNEFTESKVAYQKCQDTLSVLHTKTEALKNLTSLYGMNYYARPYYVKGEATDALKEYKEKQKPKLKKSKKGD